MDRYVSWVRDSIQALTQDLDKIAASADKAAEVYVQDGWELHLHGDLGMVAEAFGRSGGMMKLRWGFAKPEQTPEDAKHLVLVALREDQYAAHLKALRAGIGDRKSHVVVMGPRELLEKAKADGFPMDSSIDIHAAPGGGLFTLPDGRRLVATQSVATINALWAWKAEFVAACLRRGKMPVMYQSFAVPGAKERAERMKGIKFEDEAPPPVAQEVLGREFLHASRAIVDEFYENQQDNLMLAATAARDARANGKKAYMFLHGHAILFHQLAYPNSPGIFTQLNRDWFAQHPRIELQAGDFVLCVGYSQRFHDGQFEGWDDKARAAGATLAWSFAGFTRDEAARVQEQKELWIDQHWEYGDAVVQVPGLDFKLIPSSGVIAQCVIRLAEAACVALEQPEIVAGK